MEFGTPLAEKTPQRKLFAAQTLATTTCTVASAGQACGILHSSASPNETGLPVRPLTVSVAGRHNALKVGEASQQESAPANNVSLN